MHYAGIHAITTRKFKLGLYYKTGLVFLGTVAYRAWIFFGVIRGDTRGSYIRIPLALWRHSRGTLVALWRHSRGTVAALSRHCGGTLVALWRHSRGTLAALCRESAATVPRECRESAATVPVEFGCIPDLYKHE